MVWCSKSLPVQCSSFYCQIIEVSEGLYSVMVWEGQQNLVFEDFFLTGKPGGNWNRFNSTLDIFVLVVGFLPAKSGI